MDSRLLNTLNAQARNTKNPVVWARAVCRAASHFARHGKTDDAIVAIGLVRAQFKSELHREVASWLMLAEGVLHYFRAQTRESYDRIRRAYGLAVALKTDSALPSCAAWMAHIEFFDSKYETMAKHLEEALTLATPTDHQARARATLVLAMSYHLTDNYALARPWYEQARQHAAAEGDEATLSAMLHDVAAYRAANVRLIDAFGGSAEQEAHRARMEAASSLNYDLAIGHHGLDFLTQMLQGLILTLEKKYAEAIKAFESIEELQVPKKMISTIHADKAWCWANIRESNQCHLSVTKALDCIDHVSEADEVSYVFARLSQVANLNSQPEISASYLEKAQLALREHRLFQGELLERLKGISTEPKNPA